MTISRLARWRRRAAVLVGAPVLILGLAAGAAAAAGAGHVTIYPSMGYPYTIAAGPDGALWFTNHDSNSIGRITPAGVITTYTSAALDGPEGITAGPDGALWFTQNRSNTIGRITTAGKIIT